MRSSRPSATSSGWDAPCDKIRALWRSAPEESPEALGSCLVALQLQQWQGLLQHQSRVQSVVATSDDTLDVQPVLWTSSEGLEDHEVLGAARAQRPAKCSRRADTYGSSDP